MSTSREEIAWRAEKMVERVTATKSPGDRAALRRALRRAPASSQARTVHRIVAPFVAADADEATERAFYAVASMIAALPRETDPEADSDSDQETGTDSKTEPISANSCGDSANSAVAEDGSQTGSDDDAGGLPARRRITVGTTLGQWAALDLVKADTVEARLHLLCRQQVTGVHRHLPGLVSRLRDGRIEIDWQQMILDLADWDRSRGRVAKNWLQDYYRTLYSLTQQKKSAWSDTESENQ
ncbi:type I-E CRISPR-associated protein Cse2/CasB [Nocardia tengchongensis]|uniref:type I-E CRISPR-associated protein Cse2/CasB n=1 Tax=Nocardia tengchongensis TaxID=2055889 RepID=UPI0036B1F377